MSTEGRVQSKKTSGIGSPVGWQYKLVEGMHMLVQWTVFTTVDSMHSLVVSLRHSSQMLPMVGKCGGRLSGKLFSVPASIIFIPKTPPSARAYAKIDDDCCYLQMLCDVRLPEWESSCKPSSKTQKCAPYKLQSHPGGLVEMEIDLSALITVKTHSQYLPRTRKALLHSQLLGNQI